MLLLLNAAVLGFSCSYRASVTIKTLYYPTDAQIYNSFIQLELLYNVFKITPTCFGSQGIHHQGALHSAWLKLQ